MYQARVIVHSNDDRPSGCAILAMEELPWTSHAASPSSASAHAWFSATATSSTNIVTKLVALWADDGLWETWKGPLRTHPEMRAYLDAKPREPLTIHIPHNILVDVVDENRAEALSAFTYHGTDRSDPTAVSPRVVGRWRDRFIRTQAGWRFAYRGTDILFKSG